MNTLERQVRAHVLKALRETSRAPSAHETATALGVSSAAVLGALHALADAHRLVLTPGTDDVWMAHPFSAVPTDFVVRIAHREWHANCVWDGLSILALLGNGSLVTHSPVSGARLVFDVVDRRVSGDGLVHFLVPARAFWDDIGFT